MRVVTGWDKKNKILIPKDPETFVSNALKVQQITATNQYVKIFDNVNSVIRYGLHEYIMLHKEEDLDDYEDPLDYSYFRFIWMYI